MNRFDITYFYGPDEKHIAHAETLGDILASGMTLLPLCADTATNKKALRLLAELDGGAHANVHDPRFGELYSPTSRAPQNFRFSERLSQRCGNILRKRRR